MRVLHVLNTGKYSGAENVVITLIHALEGCVECAYASPDGPIREILKEEEIKYFSMSTSAINLKELKKIIKFYKPDIIHTHDYNAGVMACLTGTNVPIINHLHNNTPWLKKVCLKSIAYFASSAQYKKILTVSDSVMNEYVFGKFLRKKTQVVGNPINLYNIRKKVKENDAVKETSDIIFLGRLSEQKNPLFFLEIVSELVNMYPDLKVAMVGTGELRTEVENKIAELKLQKNVTLYGFRKNPYGLLQMSKIMCMPSQWEGFGLAAVEAMAFGKPVIASPVGGLQKIVNNDCGRVCVKKEEYVNELTKLLSDKVYYNKKSNEAGKRAEEYNNIEKYAQQIEIIYKNVKEHK